MILAVLAFLQTIVSVTVPGYHMLQGMQERIALPVEIHVPPHEENYQVVVEVIAGDVEHVSRWLVKGGKERWQDQALFTAGEFIGSSDGQAGRF